MFLAQYTIRSKQEYIFKTNKVLEIVGASGNIAKIWNVLLDVAKNPKKCGLKIQTANEEFVLEDIQEKFKQGKLHMVELFQGGGNETVLYDSEDSFRLVNRAFSFLLLSEYPGMIPMAVGVETSNDYSSDYKKLMEKAEKKKNVMEPSWDIFTAPFAMMDRRTFQPYNKVIRVGNRQIRMSDESYSKYIVGQKIREIQKDIRLFDEMVSQKGKESLLAIVHADGNNMGTKIMNMLHGEKNYDIAVGLMRNFTKVTADCFETAGEEALKECQENLIQKHPKRRKSSLSFRKIIGSGDDMTFICNARFVMDYVKAYLNSVQTYGEKTKGCEWNYSSCAGICIFHSHYPFSRAYEIAEQACDEAKQKIHIVNEKGVPEVIEQGWVDFHYIHSGIAGNLEEIRKSQGTEVCIARPWLLTSSDKDHAIYRYEDLLRLNAIMEKKGVARTTIKTIGSAFERSEMAAKKELIGLYGHTAGLKKEIEQVYSDEKVFLKALYDLAEVYDLWYAEEKR